MVYYSAAFRNKEQVDSVIKALTAGEYDKASLTRCPAREIVELYNLDDTINVYDWEGDYEASFVTEDGKLIQFSGVAWNATCDLYYIEDKEAEANFYNDEDNEDEEEFY